MNNIFHTFFLKILLLLPAEFSHHLALRVLPWIYPTSRIRRLIKTFPEHPVTVAGLRLPNPIGLAAGLDKDGRCLDVWFAMGFGFVEVGTVTPKPQFGNPKPRLFRLKKDKALINRMGFNNDGVDALVARLKRRKVPGVVGVNIGKNRDTPLEKAVEDYRLCLEKVYPYSDYVTVNISSPNTPGLRELQSERYLEDLLTALTISREALEKQHQRRVPLWIKIAPDLNENELKKMLKIIEKHNLDGVIATNTSLSRASVETRPNAKEAGGLSGAPIYLHSKQVVETALHVLENRLPVIAVGGINSPERVQEMLALGAAAVQIYSAFIYEGPPLINRIIKSL